MTIEAMTGFADQARDSARAFRRMLDAMARPGRILSLEPDFDVPAPLLPAAAAICLTLCDYDTPLWLDASLSEPAILDFLRFQTGAPITADIAPARFLLCTPGSALQALAGAHRGDAEYPDASATLIIQVPSLSAGGRLILEGPGIDGEQDFRTLGLDAAFWDTMQDNHQLFPLGCDVFFASASGISALPRSTHIKREGHA
ncbi:phosphonate C-P lyase system protein PhnH [Taklimakanibacter lacteus]|uniref:phosphonate C-P lyase system protein PhnH n=1 Tax=Taklimakanibacter lacteus TaxID=2268456 RepID=UPI000E66F0F9